MKARIFKPNAFCFNFYSLLGRLPKFKGSPSRCTVLENTPKAEDFDGVLEIQVYPVSNRMKDFRKRIMETSILWQDSLD